MREEKHPRKSALARLEEYGVDVLYSFVERDADNWWFWVKVTTAMFITMAGPAIAIGLYFLGRDLGYFG